MKFSALADTALDRSVVLGYSKIGSLLRRRWWPADPDPGALAGKRVVVTGATSGIGEAMAGCFAELGATVHMVGRDEARLRRSAGRIRGSVPAATVIEERCDVSDLDAVRAWCADLRGRIDALHGLVHNAGVLPRERRESPQGHELQLATHILGPHVMTEELLPLLRAAGGSSVVFVSSGGMYSSALCADDMEYRDSPYDGVRAYARTKRMQVVLAEAWSQRLAGTDVRVESMHPGWVQTPGVAEALPRFGQLAGPLLRDAADGADTAVWLVATRPAGRAGHFWHDRAQRPTTFGWQRDHDAASAERFLDRVSAMTGTPNSWSRSAH
ncbi:MAG: SDR family NAD(P)-dependent oxidoreductase [Actinobacteria bacterium]|nr:SDR family NAD(P)-dependent oxidoreductase [Actinomycetota bacterium]